MTFFPWWLRLPYLLVYSIGTLLHVFIGRRGRRPLLTVVLLLAAFVPASADSDLTLRAAAPAPTIRGRLAVRLDGGAPGSVMLSWQRNGGRVVTCTHWRWATWVCSTPYRRPKLVEWRTNRVLIGALGQR